MGSTYMMLSIVIPTYNERENVRIIADRIQSSLAGEPYDYEIWFIDDSRDDTPIILAELAKQQPQVHYFHRDNGSGLASAVVEGFAHSRGEYLVVMDADLQHPPELLPTLVTRLQNNIDIVIPSRFVEGGSDGGLNGFRKLVSWTARMLGQLALRRLRQVSDCTGGYFGLRRSVIEQANLDPIGWKILMEVLVKGEYQRVHEVPYVFAARQAGESKMSLREQWNYLHHVVRLVMQSPEDRRFYLYCLVGGLGVLVNLIVMSAVMYGLHLHPVLASIIASVVAMVHNFLWNDRVTWKERTESVRWRRMLQMPLFMAVSGVGIGVTALFVEIFLRLHWPELVGQLVGIVVSTIWTFTANNRWTWTERASQRKLRRKVRVTQE